MTAGRVLLITTIVVATALLGAVLLIPVEPDGPEARLRHAIGGGR